VYASKQFIVILRTQSSFLAKVVIREVMIVSCNSDKKRASVLSTFCGQGSGRLFFHGEIEDFTNLFCKYVSFITW
jgi:hypothetical protein